MEKVRAASVPKEDCCPLLFLGDEERFHEDIPAATKDLYNSGVFSVFSALKGGDILMSTLTLAIPEEMKQQMEECPEINWSEVARESIRTKLGQLQLFKAIIGKSKLTEEEAEKLALELGKKVNKSMHEKFKKKYPSAF